MNDRLLNWTLEQIKLLATDQQILKAASGLARKEKWDSLFTADNLIWGEYKGSGKKPYKVVIELDTPAYKCSCPSRKHPCKHALGLFLAARSFPDKLRLAEIPEWVQTWMKNRVSRGTQKSIDKSGEIVDQKARKRRSKKREEKVSQGVESLKIWLQDIIRQGLGGLSGQSAAFWRNQASRLVDAQAPGLARRVLELSVLVVSGEGWESRVLQRLGQLYLLLEAYANLDTFPEELQEEICSQIGWTHSTKEILSQAGGVGRWAVVARQEWREDKLLARRTWFWEDNLKQGLYLLDFAPPGKKFSTTQIVGTAFEGELACWPSPVKYRCLVKSQRNRTSLKSMAGFTRISKAYEDYAQILRQNPWYDPYLMVLQDMLPVLHDDKWYLQDGDNHIIPLRVSANDGWRMMALGDQKGVTTVGEWDGNKLSVLGVMADNQYIILGVKDD